MPTQGFGEAAEKLRRSTVQVTQDTRRERGSGSGVIWTDDGVIVTNAHVARDDRSRVTLWDGRAFDAAVIARDPRRDLASLRIAASDLERANAGDSGALRAGELVLAVGNPLGFIGALTTGVVHGFGPMRGLGRQNWVQASIRLAPGNSGGPLADAHGRVVGINTMVITGGLALAVPSNTVADFLKRGASGTFAGRCGAARGVGRPRGRIAGARSFAPGSGCGGIAARRRSLDRREWPGVSVGGGLERCTRIDADRGALAAVSSGRPAHSARSCGTVPAGKCSKPDISSKV